jgi:hypothetical protein
MEIVSLTGVAKRHTVHGIFASDSVLLLDISPMDIGPQVQKRAASPGICTLRKKNEIPITKRCVFHLVQPFKAELR